MAQAANREVGGVFFPARTLARPCVLEGPGLFTGHAAGSRPTRLTILPHGSDSPEGRASAVSSDGWDIGLVRRDIQDQRVIPAHVRSLVKESRRTVLSADPSDPRAASVQTVEHVLSALAGIGVSHARLELDGPEIPILDGSSRGFVEATLEAGVVEIGGGSRVRALVIDRTHEVNDQTGAWIQAQPRDQAKPTGLGVTYELEYRREQTGINLVQSCSGVCPYGSESSREYVVGVAAARTFCTFAEAQHLRSQGLFTHLTPRDMLVLGPDCKPIDNELRFADEPARHKVLDVIGDLALIGRPIVGSILAHASGHSLNHQMARVLDALLD